ncbi:MAG: hypothetical protein ACFFAY_15720, partial [Promethearchaeota archaeon]
MGKRLILGTEPEVDPLEEMSGSQMTITSGTELAWDDRKVKQSQTRELFSLAILVIACLYYPTALLMVSSASLVTIILLPHLQSTQEQKTLGNSSWRTVGISDISYVRNDELTTLQCRGAGGQRYLVGLNLDSTSSRFLGNMSAFVRSVDVNDGLCLIISMRPERINSVLESERLAERMISYLGTLSSGTLSSYVVAKGGIWSARVSLIGHARDEYVSHRFESSARGAIPEPGWITASASDLENILLRKQMQFSDSGFYGSGKELSEWLVQLPSE